MVGRILDDDAIPQLCAEFGVDGITIVAVKGEQEIIIRSRALSGSFAAQFLPKIQPAIELVSKTALEQLGRRPGLILPSSNLPPS